MLNIEELIAYIKENNEVTFIDIAKHFRVPFEQNKNLTLFLNSVIKEGLLLQNIKKNFFIPIVIKKLIVPIKINPKGFGFVVVSEKTSAFISSNNIHGAMDGDKVEVIIMNDMVKKDSLIGSVTKIIERKNKFLFGSIKQNGKYFDFIPVNTKIKNRFKFTNKELLKKDVFVKTEIQKIDNNYISLKIIKIISDINKPYADVNFLLESMNVNDRFSSVVLEEAESIPSKVSNIMEFDRVDLRDKLIVTVDGESTKDFDDAISVEKLENGTYKLGVYIADVAFYVKEDSEIDREALSRSTSIYLIDKVIPMLPESLSNGICSLIPNEDRFVIALELEVDNHGKVINKKLFPAIINSKYRLTYSQVENYKNEENIKKDNKLFTMIENSFALSDIISKKKIKEGYIDFEIEESVVKLDENGITKSISIKMRKSSEILIENFMVIANETVSKIVSDLKVPSIYRIHNSPTIEKINSFQELMNILKINVKIPVTHKPIVFSKAIHEIKDIRFDDLIKISLLRTMQKAKYESNNIGHFGLASEYYSHFTSPIRRYPDLILHRIIWEIIFKKNKEYVNIIKNKINLICSQSSEQEENAAKIERLIMDVKKSEFYEKKIGTIQKGLIVSIKRFGIFVDFNDGVCGFVHITNIPNGPYNISNNELQLYNDNFKFTVGDIVNVKIMSISKLEGKVDGLIINSN